MELSNSLIYGDKLRCGSSEIAHAKLNISSLKSGSSWIDGVRRAPSLTLFFGSLLDVSRSFIFIFLF